jgi:hypothetical protein
VLLVQMGMKLVVPLPVDLTGQLNWDRQRSE